MMSPKQLGKVQLELKRQGPEWEGPNAARSRLREDPMHGVVAPTDLGGIPAVPFSIIKRDSPIVGDQGVTEAHHLSGSDYPNAFPNQFAPENMPNIYMSIVPRGGKIIGDTGAGDASHIPVGKYNLAAPEPTTFPANASLQSATERFSFLVGQPKAGEGILNPNTGPGMADLAKFSAFGDFNYPGSTDHPGVGKCVKIADVPRWGVSYEERVLARERALNAERPFSQATLIEDKKAWDKDGAHRLRDTYPAPQQEPGTFLQNSRFTPRSKRPKSIDPSHYRDFKRGMSWEARRKGYRPRSPRFRRPPTLKETGSEPFLTGKKRDPALIAKVKRYQGQLTPRLPPKCVHGGRPYVPREEPEPDKDGGEDTSGMSSAVKKSDIGYYTTKGPNIHKGGIKSLVPRRPESVIGATQSITTHMEIAQYSGGLVDFIETKRTWGLATAKERFRIAAERTGVSLERALEEERNKTRKKKHCPWRPSDSVPPSKLVLGARLGSGGMSRVAEVAVLKQIDSHLKHAGRNRTPLVVKSSNGPTFSTTIVKG